MNASERGWNGKTIPLFGSWFEEPAISEEFFISTSTPAIYEIGLAALNEMVASNCMRTMLSNLF